MFALNMCYGTQSTPKQNETISLLSFLLILNKWHLVLVFLLLTLNMYFCLNFDINMKYISISIIFRIKVLFIYRKDFLKVKYLHEVAFFKISKLRV